MSRILIAVGLLCSLATVSGAGAPAQLLDLEKASRVSLESPTEERPGPVVLRGLKVMTAAGEVHSPGYVVMVDGRIAAVGPGEPEDIPEGASVHFLPGRVATPGLIDTHSHLGVYASPNNAAHSDGNEATKPTTGGVRAEDSFWPQDPGIERAVAGGVTTIQALPGSANLIGGRGVTLRMRPTRGSRAMRFPGAPDGLKMACGENPKRVYGEKGGPSTRMGNLQGQREKFLEARRHLEAWTRFEEDSRVKASTTASRSRSRRAPAASNKALEPPKRDLELETLALVIAGEIPVHWHCYRADDMLSALQLADEMGFSIRSFHHALEAYKIRDILAEKGVATSTWADWWGFKMEAYDGIPENAALVSEAGGRAIIHSDSSVDIQRLNQEAAKAWTAGLAAGIEIDPDEALRWITLNPAWALGVDDQVGSLEAGKRADVVVWSGDPFSVYSSAQWVFLDGLLVHDRERAGKPWSDFLAGQEVAR